MKISELIKFYSNISEEDYKERFPVTYKFLEENPGNGGYNKLAKLFDSDGKNVTDDPYDLKFYEYLKMLNLSDRYIFKEDKLVAKVDIFSPFVNKEKKIVSQKWHLLVALYAYLDFVNNQNDYKESSVYKGGNINWEEQYITGEKLKESNRDLIKSKKSNWYLIEGTGYRYDALKLWMAEAAGVEMLHQYIHQENPKGFQVKIPWDIVEEKIKTKY